MTPSTSWSANDYKIVADKHYKTCCFIRQSISSTEGEKKGCLMFDLYYLSGYVIECLLKYYILIHKHHCHLDAKIHMDVLKKKPYNLFNHKLLELAQKANEGDDGIDISFDTRSELFRSWSEQMRYEANVPLVDNILLEYFDQEIKIIRTNILSVS